MTQLKPLAPLDIRLLLPKNISRLINTREIKVPDVYVSSTNNFHPEGLYSVDYFGTQGSPERMINQGVINLKLPIIHPLLYEVLIKAKRLYGDILAGTAYAKFNTKTKILEETEYGTGGTGYSFFMKYIDRVTVDSTGSSSRDLAIELLKKHKGSMTITRLIVMPAGLRDYRIDADGRPNEDEINTLYRAILANAQFIPTDALSSEVLDPIRYKIQLKIAELYVYIKSILYGKRGFINKKLIDRRVHGATRNVLTGLQQETSNINDPKFINDDTVMAGMYQIIKATTHQASYHVRNLMVNVFPGEGIPFNMVDKKTLHSVQVAFVSKIYRSIMTYDGVNAIANALTANTHSTVLVYDRYYYGLVYESDDEYMLLGDIDRLPEGLDHKKVRPMTIMDMLYVACNQYMDDLTGTVTRYPVLNLGSIFPTLIKLKSTILSKTLHELDGSGKRTGVVCVRWPILSSGLFRSVSVTTSKLELLGADFDGDTISIIVAHSDEAIKEIKDKLTSALHWMDIDQTLLYSGENGFNKLTMKVLTA